MNTTELTLSASMRMENLVEQHAHAWMLPQPLGQELACAETYAKNIANLAEHSLPLAIRLSMHSSSVWNLRMLQNELSVGRIFDGVKNDAKLLAGLSPVDASASSVIAERMEGGIRFSGVRERVHMDSNVHYLPICGRIAADPAGKYALAIIPVAHEGVTIHLREDVCDKDDAGFAELESYRIELQDVFVPEGEFVCSTADETNGMNRFLLLERLNLCAVYTGIARFALDFACSSAKASNVPQWGLPLSRFPGTQFLVADAAIMVETCESQLAAYARRLNSLLNDEVGTVRLALNNGLLTMEYIVSTTNKILYLAMKIAGISSIRAGHPLARLYGTLKSSSFDLGQAESDENRERIVEALLREACLA